jgi:hypothetical protein
VTTSPNAPAASTTTFDRRALACLVLLAVLPHLGALANGFAWDDVFIVLSNPIVGAGDVLGALGAPWWPDASTFTGSGLHRPVASASLALQWALWGERPLFFHAVGVALHAGVVVLVFVLLRRWASTWAAAAGAAVFAVHPVHVEAVANVVGQAELLAALFTLAACLLYRRWLDAETVPSRLVLMTSVAASYALGIGSKEIAVMLPALVVLITIAERRPIARALPVLALLGGVLISMLALRLDVVGSLRGEVTAPELAGLSYASRVSTGLSLWPDYARLLVAPLELSVDYGPAVRFPATGLDFLVVLGGLVLLIAVASAWRFRSRAPLAALGLAWFVVVILPVSNLIVPAGVMLAERTLYLPSVGLAFVVAAVGNRMLDRDRLRAFMAVAAVLCAAYALRSAWRVPVWKDSESVLASLERSHPESHIVIRAQAIAAMEQGRFDDARAGFERALLLQPLHFSLLTEVAQFEAVAGRADVARSLARRAIDVYPTSPHGYVVLSRVLRLTGDPAAARSILLEGLRMADPLSPIWTELERSRAPSEDGR